MIQSTPLHRVIVALLAGFLVAAALGSDNILTAVEDWPPGGFTDTALDLANGWNQGMTRLGLTRLYPWLRNTERRLLDIPTTL